MPGRTDPPTFGTPYEWVFLNDRFVPADEARIGVLSNALSYGTGTFEGIRASWSERHQELFLLEPAAHYERMAQSAAILGMRLPYPVDRLVAISAELLRRNEVRTDSYLRPLLFLGQQHLVVRMHGEPPTFCVAGTPIPGDYIDSTGVRCMVSSWRRAPDVVIPSRAKVIGNYVGPGLAKTEAVSRGFDEAILLTVDGYVAEASASNIMIRRGDQWATPPASDDVLEGITLRQLRELLRDDFGVSVVERRIHRSELYVCDEALLCGTATSLVPVIEVDRRPVGDGKPGQVTLALQRLLTAVARGEEAVDRGWAVPVHGT